MLLPERHKIAVSMVIAREELESTDYHQLGASKCKEIQKQRMARGV